MPPVAAVERVLAELRVGSTITFRLRSGEEISGEFSGRIQNAAVLQSDAGSVHIDIADIDRILIEASSGWPE